MCYIYDRICRVQKAPSSVDLRKEAHRRKEVDLQKPGRAERLTMKKVIDTIRSQWPLSDQTVRELESVVVPCRFPKRYRLIRKGEYNRYAYFIEKGMTRSYWVVDGEEVTTSFSVEGGIVFSMDELYYGRQSEEEVETLEEVEAYRIPLAELTRLWETNLELCNWGRIAHQNEYRRLHRSHQERLALPARERYEAFRRQFPDVCRRANLSYIASYLGITLSTLSRLRAGEGR